MSDGVNSGDLEVEENEVAIPIPVPGRLIPIEDVEQVHSLTNWWVLRLRSSWWIRIVLHCMSR